HRARVPFSAIGRPAVFGGRSERGKKLTSVTVTSWTTQSEETRAVRAIHVRLKAMWAMGAAFLVVSGLIGWDAFLYVPYPMVSDQWVGGAFLVLIALFV